MFIPTLDVELARKALILTSNSGDYTVRKIYSAREKFVSIREYLHTNKPSGWEEIDRMLQDCWEDLNDCEDEIRNIDEGIEDALNFLPLDD